MVMERREAAIACEKSRGVGCFFFFWGGGLVFFFFFFKVVGVVWKFVVLFGLGLLCCFVWDVIVFNVTLPVRLGCAVVFACRGSMFLLGKPTVCRDWCSMHQSYPMASVFCFLIWCSFFRAMSIWLFGFLIHLCYLKECMFLFWFVLHIPWLPIWCFYMLFILIDYPMLILFEFKVVFGELLVFLNSILGWLLVGFHDAVWRWILSLIAA